jgi:hypothetical protein
MFYEDHNPPHLHADYQGRKAVFDFSGHILQGDLQSRTALRLVQEWIALHAGELQDDWDAARAGRELTKIAPLE